MTTPRDAFTAQCYEAITRLRQDIADGIYRPVADNACVDRLLRAWEKSHLQRGQYAQRGLPKAITSPQAPATRVQRTAAGT